MAIRNLNPYLYFNGDAGKAIQTYQRILGAKVDGDVSRYGDVPGGDQPMTDEQKQRVMHAKLNVGPGVLMVCDGPPGETVPAGGNTHVCLHFDDTSEAAAKFDALAQGGKVVMPFEQQFWGATFGMLVDAYGIQWMFNCEPKA